MKLRSFGAIADTGETFSGKPISPQSIPYEKTKRAWGSIDTVPIDLNFFLGQVAPTGGLTSQLFVKSYKWTTLLECVLRVSLQWLYSYPGINIPKNIFVAVQISPLFWGSTKISLIFLGIPKNIPIILGDPDRKLGIFLWIPKIMGIIEQPQKYF